MTIPTELPAVGVQERCSTLATALSNYGESVSAVYDEPLHEVIDRVAITGSLGKCDLGALLLWKRIRIGPWVTELLTKSDDAIRTITTRTVTAARNTGLPSADAAGEARTALLSLPGARTGDAFASAIIHAGAPQRMAVYDYRAHLGLWRVGLKLDEGAGLYRRYMTLVEQCRKELLDQGYGPWTAREVDLALFQRGKTRGPRKRPWKAA